MRIALVTPEFPPMVAVGGIGTHTAVTAAALAARGHQVTVVTYAGPPGHTVTDDGVQVMRLHERWLPWGPARIVARRLRTAMVIRSLRPDIVHAAEWEAEAIGVALLPGMPPLLTRLATPTYIVDELNSTNASRLPRLICWMERRQARSSAAVYAPSRSIADRVSVDWGIPVTQVISNSVDLARIRAAADREPPVELPAQFLVFLGRLERRKGIDTLGPALADVLSTHQELHAVLVGFDTGEAGGSVVGNFNHAVRTAGVADRVHLLGELGQDDALAVAARADIAVLPSRWESFGFVCVEAMALGVPVVASRVGGLAEIIEDGVSGWLVPPDDPVELAKAIAGAIDDSDARAHAAVAAAERAEHYDSTTVVDRVDELLTRTARAKTGAVPSSVTAHGYRRFFQPDSPSDPFRRIYEQKRAVIVDGFRTATPGTVVDVGGGFGRLSERLADHGHEPILCDLSPEMLEEARRRLGGRIPLVRADARRLPFPAGRAPAVLAIDLLVHLPDLAAGIDELARLVEPGGRLVFDTTNAAPWWVLRYPAYVNWRPRRLVRTLTGDGVLPEWQSIVRHQRVADVEAAIRRAGLTIEHRDDVGPRWCPKWHVWWTRKTATDT